MDRKTALIRLNSLAPQVEKHLKKIVENPGHSSLSHYKHEARIWLRRMEEALRHVGKKTAAEWAERIEAYRAVLDT
jgi:hypothetical protein